MVPELDFFEKDALTVKPRLVGKGMIGNDNKNLSFDRKTGIWLTKRS